MKRYEAPKGYLLGHILGYVEYWHLLKAEPFNDVAVCGVRPINSMSLSGDISAENNRVCRKCQGLVGIAIVEGKPERFTGEVTR